jgi:hypothetical protein
MSIVLVATAGWHALAAWHFGLFPERTLARTTEQRPVQALPSELFRFLAGLNASLVVLALAATALGTEARALAALVLCVANATQFVQDLRVQSLRLARGPMFRTILVGDAIFAVVNLVVLGVLVFQPS